MSIKKIFISHSSKDKAFASWLSKLLVCLGVDESAIFYSSDFRQGVREKISDEVLHALKPFWTLSYCPMNTEKVDIV